VSGTDEVMTNEGLIWVLLIIATIWLTTRAVHAWRRHSARLDTDLPVLATGCGTAGHVWQTYSTTRICLACGEHEIELQVFDQELAEGTDLHQWEKEL
jgi:hypothetical protein